MTRIRTSHLQLNLRQSDSEERLCDERNPTSDTTDRKAKRAVVPFLTTLYSFTASQVNWVDRSISTLGTPVESSIFPDVTISEVAEDVILEDRRPSVVRGPNLILEELSFKAWDSHFRIEPGRR